MRKVIIKVYLVGRERERGRVSDALDHEPAPALSPSCLAAPPRRFTLSHPPLAPLFSLPCWSLQSRSSSCVFGSSGYRICLRATISRLHASPVFIFRLFIFLFRLLPFISLSLVMLLSHHFIFASSLSLNQLLALRHIFFFFVVVVFSTLCRLHR